MRPHGAKVVSFIPRSREGECSAARAAPDLPVLPQIAVVGTLRSVRKLPYDVQRDMAFYRTVADFRNAVERMMFRRGTLPDAEHVFWGFGGPPPRYPQRGSDDDGLAGSRVPRRPHPDSGGAAATPTPVEWQATEQVQDQIDDGRVTLPNA